MGTVTLGDQVTASETKFVCLQSASPDPETSRAGILIQSIQMDKLRPRERKRERETQNPKQAPGSELSAQSDASLELTNREITT